MEVNAVICKLAEYPERGSMGLALSRVKLRLGAHAKMRFMTATSDAAASPVCTSSVDAPAHADLPQALLYAAAAASVHATCRYVPPLIPSSGSTSHSPRILKGMSTGLQLSSYQSRAGGEQAGLPCSGDIKSLTTTTTSAKSCASVPVVRNQPSSDSVRTCFAQPPLNTEWRRSHLPT